MARPKNAPKLDTPAPAEPGAALLERFEFPVDPKSNPPEAEPVAEVVAEPVVETPVVKPAHPSYLTRAAKLAGMDDAEIGEMDSATLEKAVTLLSNARKDDRRERDVETSRQRDESGRFTKQPEQPAVETPFDLGKELGVDTKEWDDGTRAVLTPVVKHLTGQIAELKAALADVQNRDRTREQNAHFDKLDQLFVQNEGLFGKGQRGDLDRESDELARRVAVIGEMSRMQSADKSLSVKAAFDKATKRLNYVAAPAPTPKPAPEPERDVTVPDPHGFMNGSTIRPANRETKPEPKGTRAAVAHVAERLKQRITTDPSEYEELPD